MYPRAIAERDIEICALVAQGIPASTIAERFGLPELDVMAIAVIGPEIPRHDLWLRAERERQSESVEKARGAGGFARRAGPHLHTPTGYPPLGIHKPGKLEKLEKALENQLEAVAAIAGKGKKDAESEAQRAKTTIIAILTVEQLALARIKGNRSTILYGDSTPQFFHQGTTLVSVSEGNVRSGYLYTVRATAGVGKTAFDVIIKIAVESGRDISGREVTRGLVAQLASENPDDIRARSMVAAHPWAVLLDKITDRIVILDRREKPEKVAPR